MNVTIWNLVLEAAMQLLLSDSTLNFIRQYIKLLPFSWLLTQSVFWITFADLFKICIYSCEKTETYTHLSCILYLITVRFCKHTGCFLQRRIRFYTKQLRNGWLSKNYVGSSNGIRISTYTAWKKKIMLYTICMCVWEVSSSNSFITLSFGCILACGLIILHW